MKVTMTKIWIVAGFLAVISIAQASHEESVEKNPAQQLLVDSSPHFKQN